MPESYFFCECCQPPIARAIAAANPVFAIVAEIVHVDGATRERLQHRPGVAGRTDVDFGLSRVKSLGAHNRSIREFAIGEGCRTSADRLGSDYMD
jgi:hypothetical protein